jgi:hypothetical protein
MMPFLKGIQYSLLLGPEHRRAREIEEQSTQNTVMTVIEVERGEFALKLRLDTCQADADQIRSGTAVPEHDWTPQSSVGP